MRIEQLRYFIDVAQTQSITRSAGNLFISPQGLSQAITALEKEYGMTFFERSKNGLVLNDKGSALRELALSLCEQYDEFEVAVAQLASAPAEKGRDKFSLYLPPLVILGDALAPLMDDLEQVFPSVDFSVSEKNLDDIPCRCSHLVKGDGCVALVNVPDFRTVELADLEGFSVDYFLEMPIVAKVHRSSPLVGKRYLTKQELSALPLVCFNEPVMESVIEELVREHGEPNIVMKGSTGAMLHLRKDAVAVSVGILPPSDETVAIPISDPMVLRIAAVYPEGLSAKNLDIITAVKRFFSDRYPYYKMQA